MVKKSFAFAILLLITSVRILFASSNINTPADLNSLFFEVITTKDKLPNSIIRNIEQDSLGFLWMASNDGLLRYDGNNFRVFRNTLNNTESLTSNYIPVMHLDESGNPWVLYSSTLDQLNVKSGKIKHHYLQTQASSRINMGSTYQFSITPEKNIYITSGQYGLFSLNRNDTIIKVLEKEKERFPVLSSHLDAIVYHNNGLYVGKKYVGIFKISLSKDNSEIQQVEQLTNTNHSEIFTLLVDKKNNLWAGTSDGIIWVDLTKNDYEHFGFQPGINLFLPEKEILSLYVDEWNYLWIGSRENGLSIVSTSEIKSKGDSAKGIFYSPDIQEGSLPNRSINAIYKDRDKNLWLGTYSGGLLLVSENKSKIHTIGYNPGHPKSLSHPKAWGMLQSKDSNIWIGTDGGGIDVWNNNQGIIKRLKHKANNSGISDNAILSAFCAFDGTLWFGTYRGGINRINPVTNEIKVYPKLPTPTIGEYISDVRTIFEDKKGNIWIGTNWNGVCVYDKSKDLFLNIPELGYIDVRAIIESRTGGLWIGTHSSGLIWFNPTNKEQENYYPILENDNSLPSNDIYCLYEDSLGKLWIGTQYGGLSCFDPDKKSFSNFNSNHGLANNTVLSILEDGDGYLWLSTNVGISRFDPKTSSFINYDQTNGVLPGEFLNNSSVKTKNGIFFFGGSNGVNYFNPKFIKPSQITPSVVFTELKVFNETIFPGNGIIKKNIEFDPIITLNHRQSVFTISFQAIQYPFAKKCKYSYKLIGHDEQWNQVNTTNNATYRQIPPGTYHFKVKASNSDGKWSKETASITISILPPFWKTTWAFLLYILTLLSIIYFIARFRLSQVKMLHNLQLEHEIRIKEQKIHAERLEFFTNISHEIRTPLTLIACSSNDLKTKLLTVSDISVQKSIRTVNSQTSKLLELVNRLLEFRRIETSTPQISIEKIDFVDWSSTQLSHFTELAKKKMITLNLTRPFNPIYLWADINKLSMIINNLLSNAFKHTPDKGIIDVNILEKQNEILLEIKDSGLGILPENLPLIFNRYFKTDNKTTSTGIGLAITKSLVELHHGKISVYSTPRKGSTFVVSFPKGNNHFNQNQLKVPEEINENIFTETSKSIPIDTTDFNIANDLIILLVEDNLKILDLLTEKFSKDYKVYKAINGEEGVTLAKRLIPDIIISDIMMPGCIQGTDLCSILKENVSTSHIPIILLTAKGSLDDQVFGLNVGADDYISKPFEFQILEARVNTLIQNRIKIQNYFNETLIKQTETYSQPVEVSKEQEFIKKAEELILNKYLHSDASVSKLAEDLFLSRSSLYRKIKMLTGLSINEFTRSVKIKKAAFLLATEEISVSETAFKVGYNDTKYFRTNFIKQYGETPSAYKKRFRIS